MEFLSMPGRTPCSSVLFRMSSTVLSILVTFVCLAPILEVNSTLVNMSGLFLLCEELQFFWIKSTIQQRLHFSTDFNDSC